jgi:hypothetical protein
MGIVTPVPRSTWLVSPRFDLGWFVAVPAIATIIGVAMALASEDPSSDDVWFWLASVLLIDVAHVYASLYRTYLDPVARRIHRKRLIFAPLLCLWFGALLHLESPRLFWTVLAYLAVFHFIKQHQGFAMLYARAGREGPHERRWAKRAVWSGTLAPVVWWHANLPREFAWFRADDFITGVPEVVGTVAVWAQLPPLLGFAWTRVRRRRSKARHPGTPSSNPMLVLLVLGPALTWNLGIVWFNDDRVFTLTNVVFHGVPYLALVWVAGGRDRVRHGLAALAPALSRRVVPVVVAFYGVLVVLAFSEEALWDRWIWHERGQLFGETPATSWGELPLALAVSALTVPQATHYLLDRWIWRAGPENPELAAQLGLTAPPG